MHWRLSSQQQTWKRVCAWLIIQLNMALALAGNVSANDPAPGAPSKWTADTVIPRSGGTTAATKRVVRPAISEIVVTEAKVTGNATRTVFELQLSSGLRTEVFTLGDPYRVVVDLPNVVFKLPNGTGTSGAGLVKAYRYGLFADRKARVVLDMSGPVRIDKAAMSPVPGSKGVRLAIELVPTAAESFGAGTGAANSDARPAKPAIYDDMAPPAAKPPGKPVVVIDPGHGGIDSGAVGSTSLLEKTVALAVAKQLEKRLAASGRYAVHMTRNKDVFVSLDRRLETSRDLGADLFISIHADSIPASLVAPGARGATVYTLSERASDDQARLLSEKENASDLLAGIGTSAKDAKDDVTNILFDLLRRETANFSADFSQLAVTKLRKSVTLSRDSQRSASFKVLKQPHAPSVLIELGYMSNPDDERLMKTPDWQSKVAGSIVDAVEVYFNKRTAKAP